MSTIKPAHRKTIINMLNDDYDNVSVSCLEEVIMNDPEGLKATDKKGRLPLHIAVSKQTVRLDIVRLLLQYFEDAASVSDRFWGALPLHYCVHRDPDTTAGLRELVRLIVDAFPEGVMCRDGAGFLPIHRAANRRHLDSDVIRILLECDAAVAVVPTTNGNLALHWAVSHPTPRDKRDLESILLIFNAYPPALYTRNCDNKTALDVLITLASDETMEGVFEFDGKHRAVCARDIVDVLLRCSSDTEQ